MRKLLPIIVLVLLAACKSRDTTPTVDFTLDLNQPEFASLSNFGGQVSYNNILIFRDGTGAYHAVTGLCSHDNCDLQYQVSPNYITCTCYSCRYDVDGNVTMGPATVALTKYLTQSSGSYLRVYLPQ